MIDVLAIGPHPDDIELAAAGTVALFRAAGKRVLLLDLTRGEKATRGDPKSRRREALEAARRLDVERQCLDLPDTGLSSRDPDQLELLVEAIRNHDPRVVLGMHWNDDHPDHIEGGDMIRKAVYLSGVRNYPRPGRRSVRPDRLLFAMGRRPFVPSLVVDVSSEYETKRQVLAAYSTQFRRDPGDPLVTPISDPGFLNRIEARDRYFGGMIGAEFGEPFHEPGPVPVSDINALLKENIS